MLERTGVCMNSPTSPPKLHGYGHYLLVAVPSRAHPQCFIVLFCFCSGGAVLRSCPCLRLLPFSGSCFQSLFFPFFVVDFLSMLLLLGCQDIEIKMEQFKECEKETKTKAYSNERLARGEAMDPASVRSRQLSVPTLLFPCVVYIDAGMLMLSLFLCPAVSCGAVCLVRDSSRPCWACSRGPLSSLCGLSVSGVRAGSEAGCPQLPAVLPHNSVHATG